MKTAHRQSGFTLIELLVVISILGILAALSVPALKNIGKSNIAISGSRQLLDDLGRARQFAMSRHTTVYLVFVPENYWMPPFTSSVNWTNGIPANELAATVNLADKQLSGYAFIAHGVAGDQPGKHAWHYLEPWQNLPQGTFIDVDKFLKPSQYFTISAFNPAIKIYGFATNAAIPFPLENSSTFVLLPHIGFNYLGQLIFDEQTLANGDEYIPLAQGTVSPAINPANKSLTLNSPSVTEVPPGNSTNLYNIIHIDALTGRANLEFQKVQ